MNCKISTIDDAIFIDAKDKQELLLREKRCSHPCLIYFVNNDNKWNVYTYYQSDHETCMSSELSNQLSPFFRRVSNSCFYSASIHLLLSLKQSDSVDWNEVDESGEGSQQLLDEILQEFIDKHKHLLSN